MSEHKPFFSIILPTYNRGYIVDEAISSVLEQTFTDWELLIIDDGSTDNTGEVVTRFTGDNRIKYINATRQYPAAARNKGIAQSNGNYICFLDSDDLFLPGHLQQFYDFIHTAKTGFYFLRSGMFIESDGKRDQTRLYSDVYQHPVLFFLNAMTGIISLCVNRQIFETIRFNPDTKLFWEDTELECLIAFNFDLYQLPAPTCVYRQQPIRGKKSKKDLVYGLNEHLKYVRAFFSAYAAKYPTFLSTRLKHRKTGDIYVFHASLFKKNGYSLKATQYWFKGQFIRFISSFL